MPRFAAIAVSAFLAAALAMPASADQRHHDRRIVVKRPHVTVVRPQVHKHRRHAVGHRFSRRQVIVVNDWSRRGLRRPAPGQIYVRNDDNIYLVAAATLAVLGLVN